MAILTAKVLRHQRKANGSYNVKICVYHNSLRAYIDTEHYVTDKKLTEDLQITDTFILSLLERTIDDHLRVIKDLGPKLKLFSAQELEEKQQAMQGIIHRIMPLVTNPSGHPSHGITENESDVGTKVELIVYRIRLREKSGRFEQN